jgi:hypothetical protein
MGVILTSLILAGMAAMTIAAFTFIFQTVKTACAKPVNSLRYE